MAPDASTSPVEWGPEIRVDGKRPEWLGDAEICAAACDDGDSGLYWYRRGEGCDAREWFWQPISAIRLPADHPHYRQPTTPERDPMRERLEALVWRMAERYNNGAGDYDSIGRDALPFLREAHDMTADLPKPVDPDLIEARKIAACDGFYEGTRETVERSEHDEAWPVRIALAAIKRGRELATPEVSHVG